MSEHPNSAYRSEFGGLWPDLSNARDIVNHRLGSGEYAQEDADHLHFWIDNGYIILRQAVSHRVIDTLNAEIEDIWRGGSNLVVEFWEGPKCSFAPARPELMQFPNKLLDVHSASATARAAIFSEPIRHFLKLIFERPARAFQTLSFIRGSRQPIHQDTAYVIVNRPMEMVASWIALEDVHADAGPLEYYVGSHRLPEFLFRGHDKHMRADEDNEHDRFLAHLHEESARLNLERKRFLAKKGDVLIWAADLAHGGVIDIREDSSRLSLVTHYCPEDCEPQYFARPNSGTIAIDEDCCYSYVKRG